MHRSIVGHVPAHTIAPGIVAGWSYVLSNVLIPDTPRAELERRPHPAELPDQTRIVMQRAAYHRHFARFAYEVHSAKSSSSCRDVVRDSLEWIRVVERRRRRRDRHRRGIESRGVESRDVGIGCDIRLGRQSHTPGGITLIWSRKA